MTFRPETGGVSIKASAVGQFGQSMLNPLCGVSPRPNVLFRPIATNRQFRSSLLYVEIDSGQRLLSRKTAESQTQ